MKQRKTSNKMVALLLCGALLAGVALAAGLADGDSLVTKSYLEQIFLPSAVDQAAQAAQTELDNAYDTVGNMVDSMAENYLYQAGAGHSGGYSSTFERRTYSVYDVLHLECGSGVVLEAGRLVLEHDGTVVDVTTGESVASSTALTASHRYLVAEDTQAKLTVESDAARLGLEGAFYVETSGVSATPFTDITIHDWYREAVNQVYARGLFAGTGDGSIFAPKVRLDRAMMMTVLFHLAGDPDEERFAAEKTFPDVKAGEWYETYVRWAGQQGISAGYGDGTFQPLKTLTRREVVQFLYNFGITYLKLDLSERADLSGYEGVDILRQDGWGEDAMSWAVGAGIISRLDPNVSPDRCDVAAMVAAFAEKYL